MDKYPVCDRQGLDCRMLSAAYVVMKRKLTSPVVTVESPSSDFLGIIGLGEQQGWRIRSGKFVRDWKRHDCLISRKFDVCIGTNGDQLSGT